MCGIVGFTGNPENKEQIIRAMADAIAHRGPDGEGYFCEEGIALGHRRLSIIDLEGGAQPLFNEDGSLALVFNGEIYNFMELRKELLAKGHTFTTRSDSEVLLHGFEEWGTALPEKLRGMFAFVIWNKNERELFAARDPFGIKPFYYDARDGRLLFASEIKAFLHHPAFKKEFNESQLTLYLSCQYSPGEDTFFTGVKKLLAGHRLLWKDGELTVERYFEPTFIPDTEKTEGEWVEAIDKVMADSVRAHKIADVEVGSFLSSGVDSSFVACIAKVDKTFTVGFENRNYDEAEYAKAFSKELGVKHSVYYINPEEYWENLPKIQYHMDEPLADAAAAALFFLNRDAAKQVKVCLSGEGADEFFGGYNVYKEPFALAWFDKIPGCIRRGLGKVAERFPRMKGANFLLRRAKPLEERYIGNTNLMSESFKKQLLLHYDGKVKPTDLTKPYRHKLKGMDAVTKMQYIDLHTWLMGDILLKADKMSMASSLELRVPFLDREVFALASTIPTKYRADKNGTKLAMRKAAAKHIPDGVASKKKLGFPVPVRAWLREEQYASRVKEQFASAHAAKFFRTDALLQLLEEHVAGKKDNWRQIWCVFVFLVWYEEFFIKR